MNTLAITNFSQPQCQVGKRRNIEHAKQHTNTFEFQKGYTPSNFALSFGAKRVDIENTDKMKTRIEKVQDTATQYLNNVQSIKEVAKCELEKAKAIEARVIELSKLTPAMKNEGVKVNIMNNNGQILREIISEKEGIHAFMDATNDNFIQIKAPSGFGKKYNTIIKYFEGTREISNPYTLTNNMECARRSYHFDAEDKFTNYWENREFYPKIGKICYDKNYTFNADGELTNVNCDTVLRHENDIENNNTKRFYKFKNNVLIEYLEGIVGKFNLKTKENESHRAQSCLIFKDYDVATVYKDYAIGKNGVKFTASDIVSPYQSSEFDAKMEKVKDLAAVEMQKAMNNKDVALELFNDAMILSDKVSTDYKSANALEKKSGPKTKLDYQDGVPIFYYMGNDGKAKMRCVINDKTGMPQRISDISNNVIYFFDNDGNVKEVINGHDNNLNASSVPSQSDRTYEFSPNGYLKTCTIDKRIEPSGLITSNRIYSYTKEGSISTCQIFVALNKRLKKVKTDTIYKYSPDCKLMQYHKDRIKEASKSGDLTDTSKEFISFENKNVIQAGQDCVVGESALEATEKFATFEFAGNDLKLVGEVIK